MKHCFSSADDVFRYLETFHNMERGIPARTFRLDTVEKLAQMSGNPHRDLPVLHIAGSKGKGSTAVFIASILSAAGLKAGLYLSPHIEDYRERISMADSFFPESSYASSGERLRTVLESLEGGTLPGGEAPTFFELSTVLAFLVYTTEHCDVAVVETGLGGLRDATNIVDPLASLITPIELEHTEYLGDTIALIAAEKAGIIKRNRPVFLATQPAEALEVFQRAARDRAAPLHYLPDELEELSAIVGPEGTRFRAVFRDRSVFPRPLSATLALLGTVQAANAALAALCVRRVFPEIGDRVIEEGLSGARISARFEVVETDPPTVVDGAHTPISAALAVETFRTLYGEGGGLLFGCAAGKDVAGMAGVLAPHFSRIVVTRPGTYRTGDSLHAWEVFRSFAPKTSHEPDTRSAYRLVRDLAVARGLPLLVIGSFYLVSEIKKILKYG